MKNDEKAFATFAKVKDISNVSVPGNCLIPPLMQ
jgi:hypothetical protein